MLAYEFVPSGATQEAAAELLQLVDESPEQLYGVLAEHGWGDGLPVVAPTPERVECMLAGYPGSADDILAVLPPRSGGATARLVAVNAVMAGCQPEVFPVIVAAVRAMARPEFNLRGVQATTHAVAIMIGVHGEIVDERGFNPAVGTFGPGCRANATTGRAIRLLLLHVGGGVPGDGDASTQGHPAKYTYCFAENGPATPWPLYPRSRGVDTTSAVTVAAVEGPHNCHDMWSTRAAPILEKVASVMATLGSNNAPMMASEFFIILCPEHAAQAAAEGWSREDVQLFLYERARLPLRVWKRHHPERAGFGAPWATDLDDPDWMMPIVAPPERIRVLVAGGPGKHSCVIPSWGSISESVTVPVETW